MDGVRDGDRRGDRVLPRFLAVVLSLLAAAVGVPTALVAALAAVRRDGTVFALMATAASFAMVPVWLGRQLWAGRPISPRFIRACFAGGALVLLAYAVADGGPWFLLPVALPVVAFMPTRPFPLERPRLVPMQEKWKAVAASVQTADPRQDLSLPRFFASQLFVLGTLVGFFGALIALLALYQRNWRLFWTVAPILPLVATAAWLGYRLWTGRPVPTWFMNTFVFGGSVSLFLYFVVGGLTPCAIFFAIGLLAFFEVLPHPPAKPFAPPRKPDRVPWDDEIV